MIEPGPYCFGGDVTLADICLVPQVFNARRLKVPLDKFPKIVAVDAACLKLAGLRQGAAGKPARRRVTTAAQRCTTARTLPLQTAKRIVAHNNSAGSYSG